jgi:hypothetical protein
MRKLKLRLDDLSVSTFAADADPRGEGTVAAHDSRGGTGYTGCYSCIDPSCAPACVTGYPDTCWISWDPAARCMIPR